eukprot:363665-Chlamydomonas_euryale.AAC.2
MAAATATKEALSLTQLFDGCYIDVSGAPIYVDNQRAIKMVYMKPLGATASCWHINRLCVCPVGPTASHSASVAAPTVCVEAPSGLLPRSPLPRAASPQVKLTEDEMILKVFNYLEKLVQLVKPKKLLFMAIDGA